MSHSLPPDIFEAAVRAYLRRERVDMQALAADVGISRATLYRRAGSRERVLGEVVWFFTQGILERVLVGTSWLSGQERVRETTRRFMYAVDGQDALRRFLECEPECALRVLTSPEGRVHRGIVAAMRDLLEAEQRSGALDLAMDPATTAYLIVRIGEGFLYADVIASGDREPDLERALAVIDELITVARQRDPLPS